MNENLDDYSDDYYKIENEYDYEYEDITVDLFQQSGLMMKLQQLL
jgi:hypothetical protein